MSFNQETIAIAPGEQAAAEVKPEWFQLLEAEVKRTSITAVAKRLDYSRTTISLVLSDQYLGKTDKVEKAVLRILAGSVACPYTKTDLPFEDCRTTATRKAPTHNPMAMSHWRACQNCPNRNGGK